MDGMTVDKKEKKKKKKDKKTKFLLGCIDVPSSNEESYIQTNSTPDVDTKKEEKKRKKLAKIAERNERKEKKKREKLDKKLGVIVDGEEAVKSSENGAAGSINKKKKESTEGKKDKKKKKENISDVNTSATVVEKRKISTIGDDSVVVVEICLDEEGAAEVCGKKRKLEGIVPKRKKKRKIDESATTTATTTTTSTSEGVVVKKKSKKKNKKESVRKEIAQLADCPKSFTLPLQAHDASTSINSNNVSTLISPAVSCTNIQPKEQPNGTEGVEPKLVNSENSKLPSTSVINGVQNGATAPDPPVRSSKKKKKKVTPDVEAEIAAPTDTATPIKALKNDLMAELKEKVKKKKRKSDQVSEDTVATPVKTTTTVTTPPTIAKDDVFSTPKTQTPAAKPSLGQWGKVELGSTEKTQKFFRLLGGMKKPTGSPLSFRSSKGSASSVDGGEEPEKAIMALGRKDADALNNKLEEQFKKALGGIGKGKVGLGFSPQLDPANNKFHIDANSSKSIKF